MRNSALFFLILLFVIQGCKAPKHLTSKSENSREIVSIEDSRNFLRQLDSPLEFPSDSVLKMSGKGLLTLKGKNQQEVDVQIRIKNNEEIWFSVTAFLGTEVGRMLIQKDKLEILNRLDQIYLNSDLSEFNYYLLGLEEPYALNVSIIQNLLLGIPIVYPQPHFPFSLVDEDMELKWGTKNQQHIAQRIDTQSHLLNQYEFETFLDSEVNSVHFNSLYQYTKADFPSKLTMSLKSATLDFTLTLDLRKIEWIENQKFPFNVPKHYLQKGLMD